MTAIFWVSVYAWSH